MTLDVIAERLSTDKRHARVYIDYLVKTGWSVVNVGLRTYAMRPQESMPPEPSP